MAVKVLVGSMVRVQSRWDNDVCEWHLAEAVGFAPGEWIKIHCWRAHGNKEGSTCSPVWRNKKGDREVHVLNPKGQGGSKGAAAWTDWLKPMKDAVQSVAACKEAKGGVKVSSWCEEFTFQLCFVPFVVCRSQSFESCDLLCEWCEFVCCSPMCG